MTPEGRVKDKIKQVLKKFYPHVYFHMPVQNGLGSPCLDFNGVAASIRFDIEAKAPGEKPTARQKLTIGELEAAGSKVFVIDGDTTELQKWLATTLLVRITNAVSTS
jgi:hypothetical protein